MARRILDKELNLLDQELTEMGRLCIEGISMTLESLMNLDKREELCDAICHIEEETDRKEAAIEKLCTKMILQQQPIAGDFRMIAAAVHMISDMERIGDQLRDIGEIALTINGTMENSKTHIEDMAFCVKEMVRESIVSYVERNTTLAYEVIAMDDRVDNLFSQLKRDLLKILQEDISKGEDVLDELIIGKYFERIADHAVNISEMVRKSI